jgi:hypothetical protein
LIRIVGVQRSAIPEKEFVLLQNQGSLRLRLRGHVLVSDASFEASDLSLGSHAFADEELIPPGMFVLLFTGSGTPKWAKTKENQLVYYAYMNKRNAVWEGVPGAVHILSTHHTYTERPPALLLR